MQLDFGGFHADVLGGGEGIGEESGAAADIQDSSARKIGASDVAGEGIELGKGVFGQPGVEDRGFFLLLREGKQQSEGPPQGCQLPGVMEFSHTEHCRLTKVMKILLLCWRDTAHPQGGGSERYLEHVARYLSGQGHRVVYRTAAVSGKPAKERVHGVEFRRRGGRMSVYVTAALEMVTGRYRDVDVVVDTQNGIPFFAVWWLRKPTAVLTHHCHKEQWPVAGPVLSKIGWWLESTVAPWAYRSSPYLTVSEPSVRELTKLGVDEERITIVRNGIDPVPEFDPLPRQRIHLVTLSRLVPHKQIEHALDVLAAVSASYDVVLDVIGSGWWEQELRAYARDIGIADRVVFHGHVSEAKKHALLSRAQLHVMPSRKEGWGLAVIEAGQHAVPTIGYHSSAGLRDSIDDGVTGVLVRDKAELIRETFALLADSERRDELGRHAQAKSTGFSWENTGAEVQAALERLVASPQRESQEQDGRADEDPAEQQ